ncbi:CCA tRNA nucleotidyltransferase [Curtobacterium sp. Leaf261]|uniref:CCA tRNA nucleotidyltransferase n=1 Tax=Curtobacterium sp. Leaf261 TaxID=1736311 RepID=UPI000701A029|nr:CCA tRNA nucleotidyltransferase [Curtobacterium sp. Leaf261]KQO63940.1 CCA tRNA nucleotidyltransferase [Curtobacterium sp. Leaf261]
MQSVEPALARLAALAESEPVATLARVFADAGHELALVGGPVRDAFLGRPVTDLDFTTDATPDRILALVEPVASATWDVGRQFGTIAARVHGEQVEITTYRSDVYDGETRKPEVAFGSSLADDLVRRDFTVNAMAFRLPSRELVDDGGGVEDLLAERLATPQAATTSFRDDPLRMMRGARFSAQLGFTVSDEVREAMTALAGSIENISAERVREELVKTLSTDDPVPGIRLLVDTGIAELVLPELPAMRLEIDEHHHHKDVYEHSLTVLTQAIQYEHERHPGDSPDVVLRIAALLHDIGKPATRKLEPGGVVSFHHHDLVGAKLAKKRLRALRFDNDTIAAVTKLIELHLRFFGYTDGAWTDSAVRRYVRDAGDQLERLHELTRSDVTTRNRRKADRLAFAYDDLEDRVAALSEQEQLDAIRPDLTGDDIMRILDIRPGREVGEAYRFLLEARMDEGPLDPDDAEARLRAWWAAR